MFALTAVGFVPHPTRPTASGRTRIRPCLTT